MGPRLGFFGTTGMIFIALKLMGVISWPWLWVLAPFWLPTAFFVFSLILGPLLAVSALAFVPFWLIPALIMLVLVLCAAPIMALLLLPFWLPLAIVIIAVAAIAMLLGQLTWSVRTKKRYAHVHRSEFHKQPENNDIDVDSERL